MNEIINLKNYSNIIASNKYEIYEKIESETEAHPSLIFKIINSTKEEMRERWQEIEDEADLQDLFKNLANTEQTKETSTSNFYFFSKYADELAEEGFFEQNTSICERIEAGACRFYTDCIIMIIDFCELEIKRNLNK